MPIAKSCVAGMSIDGVFVGAATITGTFAEEIERL
jgi:hypothetical protein